MKNIQSKEKIDKILDMVNIMVIIDANGKVLYYESLNDSLFMGGDESPIGKKLTDLYPYFTLEQTTIYKAMKKREPILNEYQVVQINDDEALSVINSAYPLINETGVIGGIVISKELGGDSDDSRLFKKYDFDDFITDDDSLLDRLDQLKKISRNDSLILITGETGTGKELIAHSVHSNSRRKTKPFIVQNCAEIPENLMESIMFGTTKGSFTGAIEKAGIFEASKGGTVFLDEINSLPLSLQGKLLRTIEYKTVKRVGSSKDIEVDFRVIAATNVDLKRLVDEGKFREDLYYRLNVVNFVIPPLRNRKNDIRKLSEHFVSYFNRILNRNVKDISSKALQLFMEHNWSGNVRELRNVIESSMNFADGEIIMLKDLPEYLKDKADFVETSENDDIAHIRVIDEKDSKNDITLNKSLAEMVDEYEREIIEKVIKKNKYNVLKTSKELGIPRQTLYYKLKKYDLY